MKHRVVCSVLAILLIVVLGVACSRYRIARMDVGSIDSAGRPPRVRPDYSQTVMPANIAPLNFSVHEPGERFLVKVHSNNGPAIQILSRKPEIRIPARKWRRLLQTNRGNAMSVEICVKSNAGWKRFTTVTNRIADEDIDGYIAYRKLKPNFNWWRSVGVYQRNLADYSEDVLLHGESFGDGCVNCHTFPGNDPDKMIIGIRGSAYGSATLLARDGKVEKIGAKWGYAAWHPNGKLAVYAIMKVRQFFHRTGMEIRDVVDLDSALLYYDTDERTTKTTPAIADKQRLESYPTWSPDGKYLYFCSAPIPWPNREDLPPLDYEKVKYDLVRVAYDSDTKMWGRRETVLSAQKTGLSILLPRISPDGRYLLFCMCRYGCFPVYQPSSDLYLMDLESGEHRKLAINSPYSESWHSWSSNSRWIAFSSKRRGGLFTRTYVSYVDKSGKVYKPFILPQKDPRFYDSCLETYSVPELITGPVRVDSRQLTLAARAAVSVKVDMPITTATPDSSRVETSEPWQGGRRR